MLISYMNKSLPVAQEASLTATRRMGNIFPIDIGVISGYVMLVTPNDV